MQYCLKTAVGLPKLPCYLSPNQSVCLFLNTEYILNTHYPSYSGTEVCPFTLSVIYVQNLNEIIFRTYVKKSRYRCKLMSLEEHEDSVIF